MAFNPRMSYRDRNDGFVLPAFVLVNPANTDLVDCRVWSVHLADAPADLPVCLWCDPSNGAGYRLRCLSFAAYLFSVCHLQYYWLLGVVPACP